MYSVSNDFKNAIKAPAQQFALRGYIDSESFDQDDILKGSLTISNQCSSKDEIQIGSIYIGELNATFLMDLSDYSVKGKEISFEVGIKISQNTFEYVPMGIFIVSEVDKTAAGLVIKAYDRMSLLDKSFTEQIQGTAYQIATFACSECGLTLANEDFDIFVNYGQQLIMHPNSDIETYRDLIYWIAQTLGCFVTANREGEIEFRSYGMTVVDTLDTYHRFNDGKFADYETWYSSVTATNMEDNTTSVYSLPQDDGLTYNLGSNPFLQYNNYDNARYNVLTAISNFTYVPFNISLVANPAYDLGDVLSFPDGLGDGAKKFCITSYTWKYGDAITVNGGGKNPNISSVRSKTDKEISAIAKSKSDKDVIQYYSFTNMADISIADGSTETIIDIRYTAVKKTVAIFLAEVLAQIETTVSGTDYYDGEAEFYYYFDNTLVSRVPKETWVDGEHIKHLLYYITTEPGVVHRLEIRCKMTGGAALIPMGSIKACIYGQNLVASDDWGGVLKVTDNPIDIDLIDISFETLTDSVEVEFT